MTPLTVVLDGRPVEEASVGGKANALNRLLAIGAPVPPTGAVTTAGYRRFVADGGLDVFLAELRASGPPQPADLDREAARVDEAFLEAPMSADLADAIRRLAEAVRTGGLLAVRSSATAEDMATASFAGQYRSFLEVGDDMAVLRAVRLVWASLWLPAPRAYRAHAGIDETDLAMAVVVMRLVDARRAGVAFTVNPAGDGTTLRVEAVEGLAEALVSGEVTPAAFVLDRAAPRRPPVDPVIDEVVEAAVGIERDFGGPQDVEWAHDGHRLFIVQARPITTLPPDGAVDGFDTPIGPDDAYTTAGIAEMLPGVMPPLQWTSVRPLLEEGFRRLFDHMGALPPEADRMRFIARMRGRAVLSLDLMKAAARQVPGGSSEEIERQYFGRVITTGEATGSPMRGPFKGLRIMLAGVREINARRRFRFDAETAVEAVRRLVEDPPACHVMSNEELLAYRHRVLDLASRAFVAEVGVAASAAAAYRGVELFLEPHLGEEAARVTQALTAGGIDPCGAQLALKTCDIAAQALADGRLREFLAGLPANADLRGVLGASEGGRRLVEAVEDELSRAGSASLFSGATWAESEELAWQLISQALQSELGGRREMVSPQDRRRRLAAVEARFAASFKYRLQRIMTGQLVDVRRRMLRRLVSDAVEFLHLRERTKSAVLLLGGEMRRIHLALGHRLHAAGVLESPLDIDELAGPELEAALAGRGPTPWELGRRRRALERMVDAGPLPQLFAGDPSRAAEIPTHSGDVFRGWAASAGVYEGVARIVTRATEPFSPGEILVARTTDPAWTPLFLTAGAIVVEEGGPLSHAAIIARELKLPAVLNVPGFIERLGGRSGARLVVDGDRGAVAILGDDDSRPAPEGEEVPA